MNYINKPVTTGMLRAVLTAAMSMGARRFVLWFYPETPARARARLRARFQAFQATNEAVEPVTYYEDGKPSDEHPPVFLLSDDSIERLQRLHGKLNRICDSITTHIVGRYEFVSAMIFHEEMTLFKDAPEADTKLTAIGLPFSRTPPSWW